MKKEVHERDDGKVMAIQWEYCMSGDYLASKLYWKDVSWLCSGCFLFVCVVFQMRFISVRSIFKVVLWQWDCIRWFIGLLWTQPVSVSCTRPRASQMSMMILLQDGSGAENPWLASGKSHSSAGTCQYSCISSGRSWINAPASLEQTLVIWIMRALRSGHVAELGCAIRRVLEAFFVARFWRQGHQLVCPYSSVERHSPGPITDTDEGRKGQALSFPTRNFKLHTSCLEQDLWFASSYENDHLVMALASSGA